MSRLMTYRTLLACLLAALLALLVAGQQQRAFERIWFKLEQRYGGDVARENALRLADYRVDIEARVLGAESNVSALSFDPSRRSLVSVTNQDPHFLELSLDGELLRRIPLRGFQDPEAIEYIRPGVYVVAEERRQRLVEIHVDADTRVIDIDDPRNARKFSLGSANKRNKGFEGLAYDPLRERLFVAREKAPVGIIEVNGFFNDRGEALDLSAEQEEVDVEFVLHGENGPASAWATHARIGDRLQLAAPNRQYGDDPGGYEWKPPAGVRHILLIADETALPAVAGILEELAGEAEPPVVEAFLEVPGEADILDLPAIPGARLHWLPRHQAGIHSRNGERMIEAARQARLPEREVAGGAAQELEDIDIDEEILWELASPESGSFYAWVAGESAAVMAIRRYLVQERGIDKRHLTLMGYWRLGKVFD